MRFKTKIKNEQLTVKAKLSFGDEVNDREIEVFAHKLIRGFLKPNHVKKSVVEYTGPNGISLYEHLKKPITKYEFFYMIAQIVDCIREIEKNKLFLNNLLLDMRYVYINENTKELLFIYLPLLSNHVCVDVTGFVESIVYSVKSEENTDYISRFNDFLKDMQSFDTDKVEAYISHEDNNVAAQIKKRNMGESGFITDKREDYLDHYRNGESHHKSSDDDEGTTLLDDDEGTTLLDDDEGTTLLGDDDDSTTLLEDSMQSFKNVHYASLTRTSTGEEITLNKIVFRIGKERSYVDYFVSDNHAVSRSHADIITRGNLYYVVDHNSTNHTYINGTIIPVEKETVIHDGDTLKLANEEFIFHI